VSTVDSKAKEYSNNKREIIVASFPYWDENELFNSGDQATVLAIGDSWFWYPANNLLNPINNMLDLLSTDYHAMLVRGHNGADTNELLKEPVYNKVLQDIATVGGYGKTLKAVLLSAGGNDFAGKNDMTSILNSDCSTATTAEECFDSTGFDKLADKLNTNFRKLIDPINTALPECVIFMHCYDYVVPDGRDFFGLGQWLKFPMELCKVPETLQKGVTDRTIDRLAEVIENIAANNPTIEFVDGRNALVHADWANELHPTPSGFTKIAKIAWQPALKRRGFI